MDARGFVAEDPAKDVEVVDQHVLEDAAGDLDVIHGRRAGIAAGDQEHLRLADLPRGKPIFQRGEGGIVAALEADQAGDAGFCDTSRTVASARERQIHRFFAEDRLLRRRRALDELGVRIGGRADDHRLDARVAEDLLGAADLRAVFLRELGRSCRVDVDDVLEPHAGLANEVTGVDLADATGAE